jgi:hypothetical protein
MLQNCVLPIQCTRESFCIFLHLPARAGSCTTYIEHGLTLVEPHKITVTTSYIIVKLYKLCVYVCMYAVTPTHKEEHEVMRIQTIIVITRTHSMQAKSNLLRGPHIPQARPTRPRHVTQVGARIPITTPPPWGEQLPHGTHSRTPLHASPTMP